MEKEDDIIQQIKTDYRNGDFLPKNYLTEDEEQWIKEAKLQNELDCLKE